MGERVVGTLTDLDMLARTLLVVALAVSGCSAPTPAADSSVESPYIDVWSGLDEASRSENLDCQERFGSYNSHFGVRGLACVANRAVPVETLAAQFPTSPFRSGPHQVNATAVDLDFYAGGEFGHYDPAFVRWVTRAAVPGESAVVRSLIQPIYDRHVSRIARIYWLAASDLERRGFPGRLQSGPFRDYGAHLEAGTNPEASVFAFTDASERLLPMIDLEVGNEWTLKYEANTAYGFWMRREVDDTRDLWRDGLRDLLERYDADWLASRS